MMNRSAFRTVIDDGRFSTVSVNGLLKDSLMLTVKRRESKSAVAAIMTDEQVKDLIDALQKYLVCEKA